MQTARCNRRVEGASRLWVGGDDRGVAADAEDALAIAPHRVFGAAQQPFFRLPVPAGRRFPKTSPNVARIAMSTSAIDAVMPRLVSEVTPCPEAAGSMPQGTMPR